MRILIALGGNALLRRGEPMTMQRQLANIQKAAKQIASVAHGHELILAHGNGPQVGLLALQAAAVDADHATPLDVLDAQSQGMIGYLLEQELSNALHGRREVATLLTRVEVDPSDSAFTHPTKPIGPVYTREEAERLAHDHGWAVTSDGSGFRRVVASPKPRRIMNLQSIQWLLDQQAIVIAAGGGGIPVVVSPDGKTRIGVEAVIDKDLCSALLACELHADLLLIATDVDAVYANWHSANEYALRDVSVARLQTMEFAAGSMGPKVEAAISFVQGTGKPAVIGSLEHIEEMLTGTMGTRVTP